MKVTMTTLDGETPVETTLRTVRVGDWTFRQAWAVEEITGLLPEDVLPRVARNPNDYRAALAFAVVAYMVAGRDPAPLPSAAIDAISVDFTDEAAEVADGPPAEGADGAQTAKNDGESSSPES